MDRPTDIRRRTRPNFRRAWAGLTLVALLLQPMNSAQAGGWKIKKPKIVRNIQREASHAAANAKRAAEKAAAEAKRAAKKAAEAKRAAEKTAADAKRAAKKKAEEASLKLKESLSRDAFVKSLEGTIEETRGAGRAATATLNGIERDLKNAPEGAKGLVNNPNKTLADAISRGWEAAEAEVGRVSKSIQGTWWYGQIKGELVLQFMERPDYILVGNGRPGRPVIYVNGIATNQEHAVEMAEAISIELNRPVNLIHNPTSFDAESGYHTGLQANGFGTDDLAECIYDKAWPTYVVAQLGPMMSDVWSTLTGTRRLQGDPTTRQLSWAIYHAKEPLDIVSHSQGCLQVRNALFTMTMLSADSKARNVAWVLAGPPLSDHEIITQPGKMTILQYVNDPIPKLLGLRGGGTDYSGSDHDFYRFSPQIEESMLWPQ